MPDANDTGAPHAAAQRKAQRWSLLAPLKGLRAGALAALAAGSLLGSGCSVFDPSLIAQDGGGTASPDAGADTGTPTDVDSGIGQETGCTEGSRRPNPRPTNENTGDQEVIFWLKDPSLRQGNDWADIGLNLDGLCSQRPVPRVECNPPDMDADPEEDGTQGIDNVFGGRILPLVESVFPELDTAARDAANEGIGVIMLRVQDWNGERNDPRVHVTISQTVDGTSGTGTDTAPDVTWENYIAQNPTTMEELPDPAWDGEDWFWLRENSFVMGDVSRPRVEDDNAYVSDGQLVVKLPSRVEIVFANTESGLNVRLTDGIARGTISADGTRLENAQFSGRWSINDLLETASSVGLCTGDPQLAFFENRVNALADVRSTPGSGGPDSTCNAISLGVAFEGFRGRIAGVTEGQPLPDACTMMPEE